MEETTNQNISTYSTIRPVNVEEALQKLQIVEPVWLRYLYICYPLILIGVMALDFIFWHGMGLVYGHLPRLVSYLGVLVAILLFTRLYRQLPESLQDVWDRGCLKSRTHSENLASEYSQFLVHCHQNLNSKWSWGLGGFLVITAYFLPYDNSAYGYNTWLTIGLAALSFFLNGIGLWKLVIVAYTTLRLSSCFHIQVQQAHPDESGGLSPLGDLCFTNALILLGPALYFVAWVVYASSPQLFSKIPDFDAQIQPYLGSLQQGKFHLILLGILIVEVVVFLLPLYQFHREMMRQKAAHRQALGALGQRIDNLDRLLQANIETLEPAQARKSMEEIKSLRDVYLHNDQIPTWPFNRTVVYKFISSQIIPLLSLTGLTKPLIEAVAGIFK